MFFFSLKRRQGKIAAGSVILYGARLPPKFSIIKHSAAAQIYFTLLPIFEQGPRGDMSQRPIVLVGSHAFEIQSPKGVFKSPLTLPLTTDALAHFLDRHEEGSDSLPIACGVGDLCGTFSKMPPEIFTRISYTAKTFTKFTAQVFATKCIKLQHVPYSQIDPGNEEPKKSTSLSILSLKHQGA